MRPPLPAIAVAPLLCASVSPAAPPPPSSDQARPALPAAEEETPGQAGGRTVVYETATVRDRPIATATGSVSLLGEAEIEPLAPLSAGDALDFVPGVLVLGDGSLAGLTTALLRGGDPNFTAVLVDGVPLNDATDQLGGAAGLSALSMVGVDRVEVVRGPLSSFYGSTGLGGAVNLITRQGRGSPRIEAAFESEGENLLRASLSGAGGSAQARLFTAFSATRERERIADDEFEELGLLSRLDVAAGESLELVLHGRLAVWEADDYPAGSGGPVLGTGATRRSRHDDLSIGLRGELGRDARSSHGFDVGATHLRLDRQSPAIPPQIPPAAEDTSYTRLQGGWTTVVASGLEDQWSAGIDLDWERGTSASVLLLPPALGGAMAGDFRSHRVWGGVLLEWLRRSPSTVLEVSSRLDAAEGEGLQWSPRVGIALQPGGGPLRLRASAGRAYKLPSFFALSAPPALGGNPGLRPETSVGGDLGVGYATSRFESEATLFWSEYRELIDFDFESFRLVNRSRVRARGLETTLRWRPRRDVDLRLDLTGQEVEDRVGSELRHRPEWFGSASLRWRPAASWQVQLDAHVRSQMLDAQVPAPGRTLVAGRSLVGVSARWNPAARWQTFLRVENLLDKDYETFIGFPGPDRSLRMGLRYRLAPSS